MKLYRGIKVVAAIALLCASAVVGGAQREPAHLRGFLSGGEPFDLKQHAGKAVMVSFWATWCPACRADYPTWQKVYDRYRDKGFEIVAVSIDRNERDLARFLNANDYTIPVVWRFDERENDSFPSIRKTPTTYFIGTDGTVAMMHIGRMHEDQLTDIVEMLIPR